MIQDLVIIKDGIPLLSKNLCNSQESIFAKEENLILLSGFFSALNSFSDKFESLGSISELKLSNTDLKLSFLRDEETNIIYLATFDKASKSLKVHRFLKNVSQNFLKKYNVNQLKRWDGRRERFETFEEELDKYVIINEQGENQQEIDEEININLDVEKYIGRESIHEDSLLQESPDYYKFIPTFRTAKKIFPQYYLTSEISQKAFNEIDGKKSIFKIARALNLEVNKVYSTCKSLVKCGFIDLKES